MWVFWPVVKLFNYSRVLITQMKKKFGLIFNKLNAVIVENLRC